MPSQRLWSSSHRATFLRFTLVATTIAGIDILILYLLHGAGGLNVYLARIFSYGTAMTVGYFLNNRYTFRDHRRTRHLAAELSRFYAVFGLGGLINYGVFAAIVAVGDVADAGPTVRFWLPLLGIWMGGIGGMAFNYGVSHKLVFHNR
ncbi:GtrA family protein [Arhodomonas sp. SL1]|uniref:GtrA family protein n=1 Tax=Arhodomonas sp. SL1 TaxID=3425691 RepID=UPI003F883692